ncbi:MAG: hypothetical protein AABW45_00475 [Nanoarchaeota archaeon]
MNKIKILSVDFQKDFTSKGGICYEFRPSVNFIKNILVPYSRKNNIKIVEIISDYRQPRPGDRGQGDECHPGEWGYKSEIPSDIKLKNIWIKCMNSPIWTRKNIGNPNKKPGLPYQDPKAFKKWLNLTIGKPKEVKEIVLIGQTIDCCVISTAQELNWHAYKVSILKEATDTYSGSQKEKEIILNNPPLTNWAEVISFKDLKKKLETK